MLNSAPMCLQPFFWTTYLCSGQMNSCNQVFKKDFVRPFCCFKSVRKLNDKNLSIMRFRTDVRLPRTVVKSLNVSGEKQVEKIPVGLEGISGKSWVYSSSTPLSLNEHLIQKYNTVPPVRIAHLLAPSQQGFEFFWRRTKSLCKIHYALEIIHGHLE